MALHEGDTRRIQSHHCADIHDAGVAFAEAEAALWAAVADARSQGVPWELIGRSLNVTRSAAQQRFSKPPRGRLV